MFTLTDGKFWLALGCIIIALGCIIIALAMLLLKIIRDGNDNEAEKRARLARHFCVKCGYNLRGLNGRCPECGTEIR